MKLLDKQHHGDVVEDETISGEDIGTVYVFNGNLYMAVDVVKDDETTEVAYVRFNSKITTLILSTILDIAFKLTPCVRHFNVGSIWVSPDTFTFEDIYAHTYTLRSRIKHTKDERIKAFN